MFFTVLEPKWQITAWYLLFLILLVVGMKSVSLLLSPGGTKQERLIFFFAPSLAFPAWQGRREICPGERRRLLRRAVILLVLMVFYYRVMAPLLSGFAWWLQGYLAVIPFWLLLETLQAFLQLMWPEPKRLVPAINNHPLAALTAAEFWGRRWNSLFGDWLYQVCFRPLKSKPSLALFFPFAASSLIHEILVSLPYWIVYRNSVFGWMCGYFGLQYLAVLITRKRWAASSAMQRTLCWLSVLGPVPLVLNPGTLLIFQLVR